MSSSQPGKDIATQDSGVAAIPMRFEVTTLPVADVDRAKAFYQGLGWRLDIDFMPDEHTRANGAPGRCLASGPCQVRCSSPRRTSPTHPSQTGTATAGLCKRSQSGYLAGVE